MRGEGLGASKEIAELGVDVGVGGRVSGFGPGFDGVVSALGG